MLVKTFRSLTASCRFSFRPSSLLSFLPLEPASRPAARDELALPGAAVAVVVPPVSAAHHAAREAAERCFAAAGFAAGGGRPGSPRPAPNHGPFASGGGGSSAAAWLPPASRPRPHNTRPRT